MSVNIFVRTFFSLVITLGLIAWGPKSSLSKRETQPGPAAGYGALPLNFELNQGQTNERVKFLARSEGYVLFLTATEMVMALDNPAAHQKGKDNREVRSRAEDSVARAPRRIVRMKL